MRQQTAKGTNQRNSEETPQTTLQTLEIERRHLLPISHFFALRIEKALLTRVIFSLPLQILISVTGRAREKIFERRNFFLKLIARIACKLKHSARCNACCFFD